MTSAAESVSQTRRSIAAAMGRRDSAAVVLVATVLYALTYLAAIGHLFTGARSVDLVVVADPLSRFARSTGPFLWEPIARVDAGVVGFLFSPINTGLGLLLGALVGLNLGVAYLAWRQPKACGIGAGSGVLAAIPALISGSACCAPVLLVVLGIQASGLLLLAIDVALPLGVLLLLGSLVYVGRLGAAGQAA